MSTINMRDLEPGEFRMLSAQNIPRMDSRVNRVVDDTDNGTSSLVTIMENARELHGRMDDVTDTETVVR